MLQRLPFRLLPLVCAIAAAGAYADSGVGVDTWRADKLDPTGGQASQACDEDGTSWLSPLQHRSPTGNSYNCPAEPPLAHELGEWLYYGVFQLGYIGTGDQPYALWNRYSDWRNNQPILGLVDVHFERPSDGTYAEVRGSRISEEDQYFQALYARAGAYKAEVFMRNVPNLLSTDAKPIWNGVGTNVLTLPSSLTPGESTPAQVAAVSAATPYQTLKVNREKQGLSLSKYLTPRWTVYFDVTDEERKGERPYGGPFGEDWSPNLGAILETVKPINDSTINLNTGFRYVDTVWRADIGYSGSYYRDKYLSYSFQQPFYIPSNAPPGTIAPPITQGQMSMEPDNNYHNLHGMLTRVIPMNGELSFTFSDVLMQQNSALIPPTNCQGYLGWGVPSTGDSLGPQDVGPQNPHLIPCSQWNTTAALSQPTADVSMHNTLAELKLTLQPSSAFNFNAGLKYYRQKSDDNYIAYNPENGYYGYIAENGAFPHTIGIPLSFLNGAFPPGATVIDGRVRPFILSMDEYNAYGGATWKLSEHDTLGIVYNFDEYKPTSRERDRIDDNSLKLTFIDKTLDWLTLRVNYTYLQQSGSLYDTDVYGYAYAAALPGFAEAYPNFVVAPETVNQLRKYDVDNRTENKIDLMATIAPRDDLTVSASFRGDWNVYSGVLIGRQGYDTWAAQLSSEWAPTPTDSVSAYVGIDHSTLSMASVAGGPGNTPSCADLGCAFYPFANQWWESDHERNYSAGLTVLHRVDRATFDLSWNYIYSRGNLLYSAASAGALVYPDEFATMGDGMPPTTYRVNSVTVGATVPLNAHVSLRLFDNYEIGRVNDWHYDGLDQGYVVGNTVYTDGGPQSYKQNLIGLLVNITL
jgi:hypothetical protein